jgi:hypothetical protein
MKMGVSREGVRLFHRRSQDHSMYVLMYVCVYVCMCVCIYIFHHAEAALPEHLHVCVYVCIYVCMYVCGLHHHAEAALPEYAASSADMSLTHIHVRVRHIHTRTCQYIYEHIIVRQTYVHKLEHTICVRM